MSKYIDQETLAADGWYLQRHIYRESTVCVENMNLLDAPTADVVSKGAYDQCDWERIVALTQLKEIGKGLGERMDDVRPVVRGKWIKTAALAPFEDDKFECSECGSWPWWCGVTDANLPNFCPNCGALMYNKE